MPDAAPENARALSAPAPTVVAAAPNPAATAAGAGGDAVARGYSRIAHHHPSPFRVSRLFRGGTLSVRVCRLGVATGDAPPRGRVPPAPPPAPAQRAPPPPPRP